MSSVIRKFTQAGTVKTFCLALNGERSPENTPYLSLVAQTDTAIDTQLAKQNQEPDSPNYGGIPDEYMIYTAGATAGALRQFGSGYCTPESRAFQSADIAAAMDRAISFMLQHQHEDGTIDLLCTNFHSTPDTAFRLDDICGSYTLLQQEHLPTPILAKYEEFILKAADAITVGGIHTPNHRWVACRTLARLNSMFPNPKYLARMEQWLAEGIDLDPDGQYNERSTAIYTPLTNHCLIEIARLADKPELLDNVRKNLDMSLYYMHPDGEVVTEASRRQDNSLRFSMGNYYYPYLWMAHHDQNGRYTAMAREIVKTAANDFPRDLIHFLEEPGLFADLPTAEPLPINYEKQFHHSNMVRIRREELSATILSQTPVFFTLHKGAASLTAVRLA
ncbi:hypothetical protein KAH55_01395, partial [bacterium]|nr:hypothetical protein [bacterium]